MDRFILEDLLRRVAGGHTTQADAVLLEEVLGRLDGWLDPAKSEPDPESRLLVVWHGTHPDDKPEVMHADFDHLRYPLEIEDALDGNIMWGDSRIKLWRPWPDAPVRALAHLEGKTA